MWARKSILFCLLAVFFLCSSPSQVLELKRGVSAIVKVVPSGDAAAFPDDLDVEEGALGTIVVVVDPKANKYYLIMAGLDLKEGTFEIEH